MNAFKVGDRVKIGPRFVAYPKGYVHDNHTGRVAFVVGVHGRFYDLASEPGAEWELNCVESRLEHAT